MLNSIDRAELQGRFAEAMVESMDMDTLVQYATERLGESYDSYTDEELLVDIHEFYPHLLDEALHSFAVIWFNGDEATQLQIESVLDRINYGIGEVEDGIGGAFVVPNDDMNGRHYQSWSPEELILND